MATRQGLARVLAVTSGKGGVGKSNISTNLAIALVRAGRRVCVFDADTGLANVNVLLGLRPRRTLEQLLNGQADIDDVLMPGPGGIDIVPAASGVEALTRLDVARRKRLIEALRTLEHRYDHLLLDTAAGISNTVTLFLHSAPHTLLVVTPEPTSLTDAFGLLKVLQRQGCATRVHVLTNRVRDYRSSVDAYRRLANAAERYLDTRPEYLGYIPEDVHLQRAVERQQPVMTAWPGAPSSRSLMALARNLDDLLERRPEPGHFSRFWESLLTRHIPAPADDSHSDTTAPARATPGGPRQLGRQGVIRLQQNMIRLICSRALSRQSVLGLLESLIRAVRQQYPEIDDEELQALHRRTHSKR